MYKKSVEGNALSIGGQECENGWGTHAPSELVFELEEGRNEQLRLHYGIDDKVGTAGEARFGMILL